MGPRLPPGASSPWLPRRGRRARVGSYVRCCRRRRAWEVEHVRVCTAFNRMLGLVGATVASVSFAPEGIVVGLRPRRRRPVCPCGWKGRGTYDRRLRRWRHLDLGGTKLWLEADVRRLECRRCKRVRTEEVAWARPGARHSRDLQDVVACPAQRTDTT